jgi:hypothetical protein
VAIDVTAYAETRASWEELERRFVPALAAVDAQWLAGFGFPGQLPASSIDVGPADLISITLREDLLLLHAHTSPWGPGFHRRVVDVIDALGRELDGGWDQVRDAGGYFAQRDEAALRREFLRWAHGLWSLDTSSLDGASVCLGLGEGPALVPPGHVAAPTGFKAMEWVDRTREALAGALHNGHGGLTPECRAAFLWWHREPDARDWDQLGRAICASDVIWRPLPDGDTPQQEDARQRALTCFENALRLDPRTEVPWSELHRLYELLGKTQEAGFLVAQRRDRAWKPFQGGYREGWIRQRVGSHWGVSLPGWLRAGVGCDGHDVYFDDELTAHLSLLRASQVGRPFVAESEAEHHLETLDPGSRRLADRVDFQAGPAQGYAVVVPSEREDRDCLIQGQVGHEDERVGFTVVARTPSGREAGLQIGRSLQPLVRTKVLG